MKAVLLILALVIVAVTAQYPCSAPHELTFRASQWNWGETFFNRYFGQYDRANQRVVLFEELFYEHAKHARKFLFLHYEHTGYDYNIMTKQCKKFSIGEFRPLEVPYNATFEGEYIQGGPEEGLTINRWSDKIPTRREMWVGEFSLRACYPVSQFLVESKTFNNTVLSYFYDSVVGIVNPNDFTIPEECHKSSVQAAPMSMAARLAKSLYSRSLHF